jgi:hypothetical protein
MEIDATEVIRGFFGQRPMPDEPSRAALAACPMAATTRPNRPNMSGDPHPDLEVSMVLLAE